MSKQRARVSESAAPPRTQDLLSKPHQHLVLLLKDGTALLQLPHGPQQLQIGPVPEAHFQLALVWERMGHRPSGITLPMKIRALHMDAFPLHSPRRRGDKKVLPHVPGLQSGAQEGLFGTLASPNPGTLSASSQFFPPLPSILFWERPA